ncbi:MAG: hypothetical protein A2Z91_07745 [Deltaproteobacteria bacterium GWA2_38_16]|nr:MAG: hypothetical protein A2Z91_07745 [Deltaproteobacteria bacterium GWA2_38_16]OGQ03064.1 MAG: hypothetical protein A3D19_03325 [Deltaproteobacteria bacterium RIFCSPHIGHO2_02_FULL_38_15]OGQ34963.1 MAG: hypothetical protein A3A72_07715 [Deltaproteobacteria bacterium RIFCSPLOWO2_01_FULL_38_9]OGQ61840.1 MAG: hypothetical protein A3G92_00985 [Deltaproteobacteria bacterium RIFCSPLOWO2_12_FULL_38_8]HBQ20519.1 hypothetical protein [Deltaproteobacteria bacterium]
MKTNIVKTLKVILKFLRGAVLENISLKLIAAFITLTLFVIVAGESVQISKRVKIEYETSESMMIVNDVPFEFEMVLSGPKSLIGSVRNRDFYYKVDLKGANEGPTRIQINPRELGLDRGILVSSLIPSTLYPRLERILTKKVPIELKFIGQSKVGIKSIVLNPSEVEIAGPHSKVTAVTSVPTEMLDIGKIHKSQDMEISLSTLDPQIQWISLKSGKIKIHIEVFKIKY